MDMFLSFISFLNDSRYWLGPILLIVICVMLIREAIGIAQEEIEEFRRE